MTRYYPRSSIKMRALQARACFRRPVLRAYSPRPDSSLLARRWFLLSLVPPTCSGITSTVTSQAFQMFLQQMIIPNISLCRRRFKVTYKLLLTISSSSSRCLQSVFYTPFSVLLTTSTDSSGRLVNLATCTAFSRSQKRLSSTRRRLNLGTSLLGIGGYELPLYIQTSYSYLMPAIQRLSQQRMQRTPQTSLLRS